MWKFKVNECSYHNLNPSIEIEFCSTQDNIETESYEKYRASIQTQRKN